MTVSRHQPQAQPFAPTTFSTSDFRWLHQEGWENYHNEYFAGSRGAIPLLISAPPPAIRKKDSKKVCVAGRWILEDATNFGKPIGWAEAQFAAQAFSQATLSIYIAPEAIETFGHISQALCLLISGNFILGSSDLMTLIPYGDAARFLGLLSGTQAQRRLSFMRSEWATPNTAANAAQQLVTFSTSRIAWNETVEGLFASQRLHYLEKRLKDRDFSPPRFKRGLLGFLFPKRPCC